MNIGQKPFATYLEAALFELKNHGKLDIYALGGSSAMAIQLSAVLKKMGYDRTTFEPHSAILPARHREGDKWVMDKDKPGHDTDGIHITHTVITK